MPQPPNILANIDKFVREEIEKGEILTDARIAIVGTVDQGGAKIVAAVKLTKKETNYDLKIKAIFEHDWDGDNSMGAKLIFSK